MNFELDNGAKLRIMNMAYHLFLKKIVVNTKAPNVVAAIITAASKMAIAAGADEDATREFLIEAFGELVNEEARKFIDKGISPTFVQSIIGFSTDFNDSGLASVAYESQKDDYDSFYRTIKMYTKSITI